MPDIDSFIYVYSHMHSCMIIGIIDLLSWQSQNAKVGIPSSTVDTRRHSNPRSFCEAWMPIYLFCCLIPSQLCSERTTKSPPREFPLHITGLWPWPHGSGRKDLTRISFIFPPLLAGQWARKWRTQCRFTRLIIRSQLIPIPIIWQLGPVDQHRPLTTVQWCPAWKHPFFLITPPPLSF